MSHDRSLEAIFNPRSVAIAGAVTPGAGQAFLTCLLDSGYTGKLYVLSPKGGEVLGIKAYPNVKDVPGDIDLVVSCVPAHLAPRLLEDYAVKGVKAVSYYTAGFSEMGDIQGRELDAELLHMARAGGVRILGPNCIGVYNPKIGLSFSSDNPKESGRVGLICQSGGCIIYLVRAAGGRGVRFSKAVSYGNALDIDETELLEYFGRDSETEVIAAYVEGIKDGKRFFKALKEVSSKKPVIVLKGGHTEAGARAASSHTASLAGSDLVWDHLLTQAGVIRVYSLDELVDMLVAFSCLDVPEGRVVAVIGGGGGFNVIATDAFTASGFFMPPPPEAIRDKITKDIVEDLNTEAGFILSNPFDITLLDSWEGQYKIFNNLAAWEEIDLLVGQSSVNSSAWPRSGYSYGTWPDQFTDTAIRIHNETGKPVALILHNVISIFDAQRALELRKKCCDAGLPVFESIASAAKAIDRFMRYHERRAIK